MTQFLEAELHLSEKVYQDNPELKQQINAQNPPVIEPDWKWINEPLSVELNVKDGFFAEAFTDDKHDIIIAFQGSIFNYDPQTLPGGGTLPGVVNGKPDSTTKWAMASQDADLVVLEHGVPNAYKDALEFTQKIMIAYPDDHIYLTGHSLGGAEAEYVASNFAFNTVSGDTFGAPGIFEAKAAIPVTNLTNYVDVGDPIGNYGGHFGQVVLINDAGTQPTAPLAATVAIENSINQVVAHNPPASLAGFFANVESNYFINNHLKNALGSLANHVLSHYEQDIRHLPSSQSDLLFSENFDNFGQTAPVPYVADLAQHGWTNVNNGGETTVQLLPKNSSMDFYLNTRDTDGLELLIGNTFKDPTGGKAMLSFDFSTLPGMNVQDSLIVMTDNIFASNIVATFKGADQTSGWHHADIVIDTGGTPNVPHSFFINERGNPPSISSTGFAVDNIQIHDYLIV